MGWQYVPDNVTEELTYVRVVCPYPLEGTDNEIDKRASAIRDRKLHRE